LAVFRSSTIFVAISATLGFIINVKQGIEMTITVNRHEIDHHTIKLIVGFIAISLASITSYFSEGDIASISESYHVGGWARDYFVGSLFAIFAFFLAYNGETKTEMLLSKIAAFASLAVAVFPCRCEVHEEIIPGIHGAAAAIMFIILAVFCWQFRKRAMKKKYTEAKLRSVVYSLCACIIIISILVLAIDHFSGGSISAYIPRLTYYGEMAGLVAFGFAWLTASRTLPLLTNPEERFNLLTGTGK
jgi:hypothetical protein